MLPTQAALIVDICFSGASEERDRLSFVLGGWEKELHKLHESQLPIPGIPWELPVNKGDLTRVLAPQAATAWDGSTSLGPCGHTPRVVLVQYDIPRCLSFQEKCVAFKPAD